MVMMMVTQVAMQWGALQVIEKDQQYTTACAQFERIEQGLRLERL
jgi:hypothetical protein